MFSKVHGSEFDVRKLDLIISPFKFKSSTISLSKLIPLRFKYRLP